MSGGRRKSDPTAWWDLTMKHFLTRLLFRYWCSLSKDGELPFRRQVEPRLIKPVLPYTFILQRFDNDHIAFRLAGTEICHLFGREFRDQNFLHMWEGTGRRAIRALVEQMFDDDKAAVINFVAETLDKTQYPCEILLLPMLDEDGEPSRILGAAIPLGSTAGLSDRKFVNQTVKAVTLYDEEAQRLEPRIAAQLLTGAPPSYLRLVHSAT
jgi:hypothetical protein